MPHTQRDTAEHRTSPSRRDAIGEWLDVFVKLLRLPEKQADQIRDELEDHLRSRVDDLMIGGLDESEATRRAVEELGTTVELARRFRLAETHPRRRLIMQLLTCAIVGGAVALGVTTMQPTGPGSTGAPVAAAPSDAQGDQPGGAAMPQAEVTPGEPSSLRNPRQLAREKLADVRISADADTSWEDFFNLLAKESGKEVEVRWDLVGEYYLRIDRESERVISPDRMIKADFSDVPGDQLAERINEVVERTIVDNLRDQGRNLHPTRMTVAKVDLRVHNGTIIVSIERDFDVEEMMIVIYDVGELAHVTVREAGMNLSDSMASVLEVLQSFVEPRLWSDTQRPGTPRIHGRALGTRLIIEAPQRVHPQIEAMLKRFVDTENHLHIPVGSEEARKPEVTTALHVLRHASPDDVARSLSRSLKEQGFDELARVEPDTDSRSVISHTAANRSDIGLMVIKMIESIDRQAMETEGASNRR